MLLFVYISFLFIFLLESRGQNMEGRIIGGNYVNIRKFPHCAFLSITCGDNSFSCGASIVNQRLLLTAAHCVEDCFGGNYDITALVGTDNIEKAKTSRRVQRFITHAEYDIETVVSDIALMYLQAVLRLGPDVKRVLLGPSVTFNNAADVAGWGIISRNQDTDEKLKSIQQQHIPYKKCKQRFGFLRKGMMCAKAASINTGPASGDSGSALVLKNNYQVGIVSTAAGNSGVIIYTNVTYYYNWIRDKTAFLYCYRRKKKNYNK